MDPAGGSHLDPHYRLTLPRSLPQSTFSGYVTEYGALQICILIDWLIDNWMTELIPA